MNPPDAIPPATRQRSRVYVVDDDDAVRAAVSMLVGTCGWEAVPCLDAEDFLARYTPRADQCMVLDLRMPGMSGLELQQELQRRGDDIPVIVVTAHHELPHARFALEYGAQVVLGKPFRDQELLDWVRCALEPRQSDPGAPLQPTR